MSTILALLLPVMFMLRLTRVVLRELPDRLDLFDTGHAQVEDVAQASSVLGDGALHLPCLGRHLRGLRRLQETRLGR